MDGPNSKDRSQSYKSILEYKYLQKSFQYNILSLTYITLYNKFKRPVQDGNIVLLVLIVLVILIIVPPKYTIVTIVP